MPLAMILQMSLGLTIGWLCYVTWGLKYVCHVTHDVSVISDVYKFTILHALKSDWSRGINPKCDIQTLPGLYLAL
jgi:hypothetical protein